MSTKGILILGPYTIRAEATDGEPRVLVNGERWERVGARQLVAVEEGVPLGAPEFGDVRPAKLPGCICGGPYICPVCFPPRVHPATSEPTTTAPDQGESAVVDSEISAFIVECHATGTGQAAEVALKFARAARAMLSNEKDPERVVKARGKLQAAREVLGGGE